MKNVLWLTALGLILCPASRAQSDVRQLTIRAAALLTQNFCTNTGEIFPSDGGFYFKPQLGGIGELTFAYRPRKKSLGAESGLGMWLWGYKVGMQSEAVERAGMDWRVGQSASGIFIPLRAVYAASPVVEIKAGALLVAHMESSAIRGSGFVAGNGPLVIEGESVAYGRTYNTIAADLLVSLRVSRRFAAVLRGTVDTKAFPAVQARYTVTEGGVSRTYRFDHGPKMAFLSVGASYLIF